MFCFLRSKLDHNISYIHRQSLQLAGRSELKRPTSRSNCLFGLAECSDTAKLMLSWTNSDRLSWVGPVDLNNILFKKCHFMGVNLPKITTAGNISIRHISWVQLCPSTWPGCTGGSVRTTKLVWQFFSPTASSVHRFKIGSMFFNR